MLVTAALPYANADLHIGHVTSTYIPADVYSRFRRLKGDDILFVCGSDYHGTPIEVSALAMGKTPAEHAEYYRLREIHDFQQLNISFDNYYYTGSEENRVLTEEFLNSAYEKNYIYQKEVEQSYCEKDKRFLPDRFVKGQCPYCGAADQYSDVCEACGRVIEPGKIINPSCIICGTPPVKRKAKHFFFKLSALSGFLSDWLSKSRDGDFPREVVNYVLNWVKSGLEDWDITREDYWGFRLPFKGAAPNQYAYVWWDAPIGYIASTVNLCSRLGISWERYWKSPESRIVHFIGKDIIYHHLLFWPAMLKVAGYPLPKKYVVNGYLTLESRKMSKSRKWGINLRYVLDRYPSDYIRFYLATKAANSIGDSDFSWKEFQDRINTGLADAIGNLVNRVLKFTTDTFGGEVPEPQSSLASAEDRGFKEFITRLPKEFEELYEKVNLTKVVGKIVDSFGEGNRYFNAKEPWRKIKAGDREGEASARTTLYLNVNLIHDGALYLYPIAPNTATQILSQIFGSGKGILLSWDILGKFAVTPGTKVGKPKPVAEKIKDEDIKKETEALEKGIA
ncbi:MAG: methionine--tRNA ligase [Promethearchaeati archaeon SRVP18_Atabeyarchaeia-1]